MDEKDKDVVFELSLLDNGIDFILKGIDELFEPSLELRDYVDPKDRSAKSYKYGILNLFSGFLLLLKERLRLHLDVSIFKGQIKDVRRKLAKNEIPHTVDLDEALEKLALGPKVEFDESKLKTIRKMQNYRNLFEHYQTSANRYELWATISDFLDLIDHFLVKELDVPLESVTEEAILLDKIKTIGAVWERVITRRKDEWSREIENKVKKFRRGRKKILAEIEWEQQREKGAYEAFISCPECYEDTLIADGDFAGICTNKECNTTHPLTDCSKCGQITTGFYWEDPWCNDCEGEFDHYMSKND